MTRDELLAGAAGAIALLLASLAAEAPALVLARLALLGAALGAVTYHDLREHRIPNRIVVPAIVACGALLALDHIALAALAPALALAAVLVGVALAAPAALGMGDAKLAILLAVGLDGDATAAIIGGFVLAAVVGLLLILRLGPDARRIALPLAPFLAASGLIAAAFA